MGPERIDTDWRPEHNARYPFSQNAKNLISDLNVTLDSLLSSRTFGVARSRAKERVIEAIEEGKIGGKWAYSDTSDSKRLNEIISYPLARMIVSCIDDGFLHRRYALAEAENVSSFLENEEAEVVFAVARELGLDAKKVESKITVDFLDFIEITKDISAVEWKLVNQDLREGRVYLDKHKFIRLLKERTYHEVLKDLPIEVNTEIESSLSGIVDDVMSKLEEMKDKFVDRDLGEIEEGLFPPCIKELIKKQAEGQNLSHEARFALTAFLHKIGFDEEQIMAIFSKSPDFRIDLARYQIEHVIGKVSSTEYTPPGCDYMKTGGLCFKPDELCGAEWMSHPLTYYSYKKRHESEEKD